MGNYYKYKNLSSDVRAILLNKDKVEKIVSNSTEDASSITKKEKNPITETYTYIECKKVIRRVDRWALYSPYRNDNEDKKKQEAKDNLKELQEDLSEILKTVSKEDIEFSLAEELKNHRVFTSEIDNAYELSLLTEELLSILKSYR